MVAFLSLHSILSTSKKMVCKVDYLASSGEKTTDGIPLTLGSIIRGLAPNFVLKSLARKAIGKFSKVRMSVIKAASIHRPNSFFLVSLFS